MKLTPEQKAFFEYGKALGKLEKFRDDHKGWKCVNFLSRRHYWRSGNYVCCETQDVTEQHALLIRDAWQKRAACRAWINGLGSLIRKKGTNNENFCTNWKGTDGGPYVVGAGTETPPCTVTGDWSGGFHGIV